MAELSEQQESLWWLVVSPTVWALHFVASYATAAVWCAKVVGRDGSLDTVRILILVYTAGALLIVGVAGARGFRRHSLGTATVPHDFDTPADRHRFLGFSSLLLSGLSAVAIVFVALTVAFFGTCR